MLKVNVGITAFIALLALAGHTLGADQQPPGVNVLAWPRMPSSEFGCYMEKTLGHRDKRFNCSLKRYRNQGDPCKNPDTYNEGPLFPASLAARIHPLATQVQLNWEHGELQQVTVTLKGTLNEVQLRKAFELPRAGDASPEAEQQLLPKNIMDAHIEHSLEPSNSSLEIHPSDPSLGLTSVTLVGFEHMGAGDVDCDTEQ